MPPGVNPIAVNKYINIKWHSVSCRQNAESAFPEDPTHMLVLQEVCEKGAIRVVAESLLIQTVLVQSFIDRTY